MQLEELEQDVIQWAADKGILQTASPYKQADKTLSECGELIYAIGMQDVAERASAENHAHKQVKDAIGDITVTLIIQAKMQGLTLTECVQAAYDVIKNRTGKMVDGQFVKDAGCI
jgi:NTP pyrophosphatase (non-canonical NTP hydrolase)